MNDIFDAFILSIVQGLTEFLPISSSGHLVLFEKNPWYPFGSTDNHLMNVILHFGTMVATVVVFREDLIAIVRKLFSRQVLQIRSVESLKKNNILWLTFIILIGTIPTGIIGLLFRDFFKSLESRLFIISIAFLLTGTILLTTRFFKNESKDEYNKITIWDTLLIGLSQGIAITPGISRSGITISTGLWLGIRRDKIGRYSFLLSLPAIFAATLLELGKVNINTIQITPLLTGFFISFVTGYVALKVLLKFVNQGKLHYFSYYCWAVGVFSLVISIYF